MSRLKKLSASLLICLANSGCASFDIPDLNPGITLPASGDGFRYTTISNKETVIPKAKWDEQRKRGIILFADDWAKLKVAFLKNCLSSKCRSTAGALDSLFYSIDDALKRVPKPKTK